MECFVRAAALERFICPIVMAVLLTGCGPDSGPKADEWVAFYPTYGRLDPATDVWVLSIHGWVSKEESQHERNGGIERFANALGVGAGEGRAEAFRARARPFLADSKKGRKISIRVGEKVFALGESGDNGHVETILRIPVEAVKGRTVGRDFTEGWLPYRAVTRKGDRRDFSGAVQLVAESGLSVISDIDDTIKVTQVLDRRELLANTFLREYRPVPGMAEAYQRWARAGAVFHYVTASPWQLYEPLSQFLRNNRFPAGSLDMKYFRWKDPSLLKLFASPEQSKPDAIARLLAAFPRRRFILVGDSGEKDPEIYGALARKFPGQVAAIFIRNVSAENPDGGRFAKAFADVPKRRWIIFESIEDFSSVNDLKLLRGEQ